MDLDDQWEFLPSDGFIDLDLDLNHSHLPQPIPHPKSIFNMDYFFCPPPPTVSMAFPNQLVHLPILNDDIDHDKPLLKQITQLPTHPAHQIIDHRPDKDGLSQVFFKKMKETDQLADMKITSPRPILPHLDDKSSDQILETTAPPTKVMMKGERREADADDDCCDDNNIGGFDFWKWSLTGIGAICSFGVAAATMFIVILGTNSHRNKQQLRFEIYDGKRIKEVVQHASKWNEAIFAVRGVPVNRAPISFAARYDDL